MIRPRKGRGPLLALLALLFAAIGLAMVPQMAMQLSTLDQVEARAERLAGIMRVIRPVILLVLLLAWRPAVRALHQFSIIDERAKENALGLWPRLAIWTVLIEITLGQGYLIPGLLATATYWLGVRRQGV